MNDEQIEKVRVMLAGSGWREVMEPIYKMRRQMAVNALVQPLEQRSGDYKGASDDVVRGRIQEIDWTLTAWRNQVVNHEVNRLQEERNPNSAPAAVIP